MTDTTANVIAGIVYDDALSAAIGLADKLARTTSARAYVVNDQGHPMLASGADISADGLHYWTPEQIVYAADPPPDDAPGDDCPDHGPYADDDCPKCGWA